jgi:AcrR family transcriptional regulator
MARLVDHTRRTALLDRVVAYLGNHGLVDVSFRPMAKALDVSVNALVHHFGTKDDLLAAALRRSGQIQQEIEQRWRVRRPDMTQVDLLRSWWRWTLASPENLAIIRLGIEAVALEHSLDGLGRRQRGHQIENWRSSIEQGLIAGGLSPSAAAIEASITRAVFGGLVIELIATGQKARLTRAFETHLARLERLVADAGTTSAVGEGHPAAVLVPG